MGRYDDEFDDAAQRFQERRATLDDTILENVVDIDGGDEDAPTPQLQILRRTSKLPSIKTPTPESVHTQELRHTVAGCDASLASAARLTAIGGILADGALEMHKSMNGRQVKAWVDRHAAAINRAYVDAADEPEPKPYSNMRDLRHAVMGAANVLDEASRSTRLQNAVAGLYAMVDKICKKPDTTVVGSVTPSGDWWKNIPWWGWLVGATTTILVSNAIFAGPPKRSYRKRLRG